MHEPNVYAGRKEKTLGGFSNIPRGDQGPTEFEDDFLDRPMSTPMVAETRNSAKLTSLVVVHEFVLALLRREQLPCQLSRQFFTFPERFDDSPSELIIPSELSLDLGVGETGKFT
jgi:hypothetical protein